MIDPALASGGLLASPGEAARMRLDKWLWAARFLKSRSQGSALCASGRLRLNGTVCAKSHQIVRPGDVLTFPLGRAVRVIRVRALALRRGPPAIARLLYDDLSVCETAAGKTAGGLRDFGRP
jgi:ribosome-associated heat shock protein Hsp15